MAQECRRRRTPGPARRRAPGRCDDRRQEAGRGEATRELGEVGAEHQAPGRRLRPAPLGDVVQEAIDGQHPATALRGRQRLAVARRASLGHRAEVGLDVMTPVRVGERR